MPFFDKLLSGNERRSGEERSERGGSCRGLSRDVGGGKGRRGVGVRILSLNVSFPVDRTPVEVKPSTSRSRVTEDRLIPSLLVPTRVTDLVPCPSPG